MKQSYCYIFQIITSSSTVKVYSALGYLRCIITSATVNRSWPHIVNTEIKAIHFPCEVSFWKADGDKTEAETVSRVLSAFSLSVASRPLFGLFWQVSFSLHCLSPQAPAFSLEVSPARCGDLGFSAAACVARALKWWGSHRDAHHLF